MATTQNILRNVLLSTMLLGASVTASAGVECTDRWGHRYAFAQAPADAQLSMTCTQTEEDAADDEADAEISSAAAASMFGFGAGRPLPGSAIASRGQMVMITVNSAPRSSGALAAPLSAGTFDQAIEAAARAYGHDADLLRAIIHVESRGNPNAVSPKGAIGLMQVMPTTAAGLGLEQPSRALFEPEANIRTGAIYLRRLMKMFDGRTDLVVAAYNAGEGSVRRYKDTIPPFPETQAYVRDVLSRYDSLRASR